MTQPADIGTAADDQEWQSADQLQGMQAPPPEPAPDLTPPPLYKGAAPPGSLTATPVQATAETLNNIESQKDVEGKIGDIAAKEGSDLAAKEQEAAAEKVQQSADYNRLLQEGNDRHEANHKQLQDAYQEYRKQAGHLKDPTSQFWEDKGTPAHILSGFAAFASGAGAGLLGQGGNPYLDYLNKRIEQNYDSHKTNINDLYQSQVAAGKIADDEDSYQRFVQEAKLHSYDLASEHIKHELESIKNNALGENQRQLAKKTIIDLDNQGVARRQALAQQQAQAAAAHLAAQRQQMKEVRDAFKDSRDKLIAAGYGDDEATAGAAKSVQAMGYDRSLLAPIMQANGATYDEKQDKFIVPEPQRAENPDELIPTKDPVTGRNLKPEEREKLVGLKVTLPDGTVRLANNADDQKKVQQEVVAHQTVSSFMDKLNGPDGWLQKYRDGTLTAEDIGQWEGARKASIESYKALSGAEGNTGVGTARMLGEDEFPEPPGLVSNTILGGRTATGSPSKLVQVVRGPEAKRFAGQVANMKELTARTQASIERRLRPAPSAAAARPIQGGKPKIDFTPAR